MMKKFRILFLLSFIILGKIYAQNEVLDGKISFYQKYISDLRNGNCPMYPSCSDYGIGELKSKFFAFAMPSISERLLRCGHDYKFYDVIYDDNKEIYKLLDTNLLSFNHPNLQVQKRTFAVNYNDSTYSFVKELINEKDYSNALLELKRIKFSNLPLTEEYYANELSALYGLEEFEKMIFNFETNYPLEEKQTFVNLRLMGDAWYRLKNQEKSIATFSLSGELKKYSYSDSTEFDKINFNKAIILTELGKYKEAISVLNSNLTNITPKVEALKIINDIEKLKYKNRNIGTLLNIVPGLGYFYAGHKTTAVSSFILNSLLGYGFYTSLKTKNYGVAALTGIFSLSFYIGNITGGKKSVDRYNFSLKNSQLKKITIY